MLSLGVVFIGLVSFMVFNLGPIKNSEKDSLDTSGAVATMYKSPTCGCCSVYASYMKREGYEMKIGDVENMGLVKKELGVPPELESCHTMEISGYVIEGHIPEEAIQKLLVENPDIKGIGLTGMPAGSPGMPGSKTSDFAIYEITHEGSRGDVFMVI